MPEDFILERIPHDKTGTLKAHDAADRLVLSHWYDDPASESSCPLILNDAFGALTLPLAQSMADVLNDRQPLISLSDSFISQQALKLNAKNNGITQSLALVSSINSLPNFSIDKVLMKLPKSAQYFDYQLAFLNHYLPANTPVVIGGMVKYMSRVFFDSANRSLNEVSTSLAVKKARLIFGKTQGKAVAPTLYSPFKESTKHLNLYDCPNGFSRGKLDIGSRFLLDNFPDVQDKKAILDIGCGCGVLGLTAAKLNSQANITLIDESYHAIAATQYNIEANFDVTEHARFNAIAGHNMDAIASNSQDVVLCNPPFHQGNTVGTQVALQMFSDAKRVLAPSSGVLVIIANRHLNYHHALRKRFTSVSVAASNKKFVVLICRS